jgi:hypothetical protein
VYNHDLVNGNGDDLTIAKIDAIFNLGNQTPRDQMILAQLTALKLNLAITALQGTCGGLVQFHTNVCLTGVLNVSGIPGATAFFGTATPTIDQVVDAVESRWIGVLTTNRANWRFNFTKAQQDMIIKVLTGTNEGFLLLSPGC